ncbi:MAG: hypothetical protein ABI591_05330 [Kofleriaceae bacterium]
MIGWAKRTVGLHRELAAIAEVDPRYWLLAGGVAITEQWGHGEAVYLACDAEPDADTFMAYRAPRPRDLVADAIVRAKAARTAILETDRELPDQALAVTIDHASNAATPASALDVAAFAIGRSCVIARLDDPALTAQLTAVLGGGEPRRWTGATPFVCISVGDEPLETARHGHRRAWTERGGPWLGLGRAGELAVVSTCHLIIDGYGHARIAARLAELVTSEPATNGHTAVALAPVAGAVPLAIAWREMPSPTPKAIPLAYDLGCLLHRHAGRRDARFSPTFQIPIARGAKDDPMRLRRRVVSATASVRFVDGTPEPFAIFTQRVRAMILREANANGLATRLLAAARGAPVPTAWKRKGISAKRPRWMEGFASIIGGRALLSRIVMDVAMPPMCAASSPSRLATDADPTGGCVITILDDGARAAITVAGSGVGAGALLEELVGTSATYGASAVIR